MKDVRAFLGLANYYRKFVKDFAKIAGPLHELTKKGLKFQWTNECQAAFDLLKTALTQAPILAYPDFTLPFDLYVDASDDALDMVLGQIHSGREVIISYRGRKLLPAEKNYSVTEREALAAVAGVKYFQPYLYGRKFTIHTDHNAVRWLMNIREPTGRLARWALLLQQYDFEIVHRSGKSNGNADALSRREYDSLVLHWTPLEYKQTELGTYNAKIPLLPTSLSTWNLKTFPRTVNPPRNFSTRLSSITLTLMEFCATFGFQEENGCQRPSLSLWSLLPYGTKS